MGFFRTVGTVGGGAAGAYFGGPAGAVGGATLGNMVGGWADRGFKGGIRMPGSGGGSGGAVALPQIDPNRPFGLERPKFEGEFTDRLRAMASETGPSEATRFVMDQARVGSESQLQSRLSNIAASSGLSAGARERLSTGGMRSGIQAVQEAAGRGTAQDIINRQNLMSTLDQQQRAFAMQDFQSRLQAAAAQQLAAAQIAAAANQPRSKFLGIF